MDVSVVLPVLNERDNLVALIPRLSALFKQLGLTFEVIAVDGGSRDGTREIARSLGARVVDEKRKGYGGALATGLEEASADFVLTLDADMSHDPGFVSKMWRARHEADIVIASRYVRGGAAYTDFSRRALSQLLNFALRNVLAIPAKDVSSGFRLYRRAVVEGLALESDNFEVQEEILVKAQVRGFRIKEVPFTYFPRGEGRSHARVLRFGIDLMREASKLWALRYSEQAADFDERAFYSWNLARRMRERRRHRLALLWARSAGRTLHVGGGSSAITESLDSAVALDDSFSKLRLIRRSDVPSVQGCAPSLPFKESSFQCLIVSRAPARSGFTQELAREISRVLKSEGILIVDSSGDATPIRQLFEQCGFVHHQTAAIGAGEELMSFRKSSAAAAAKTENSSFESEDRKVRAG